MNASTRLSSALLSLSLVPLAAPLAAAQSSQLPRGSLAPIGAEGTASGWAHHNTSRSERVYFSVDAGAASLPALSVLASEQRSDVNRWEGIEGDHGFRFTIPTRYRDGRAHVLYAYVRDPRTGRLVALTGSPRHFHLYRSQAPKVPERWYEDNNLAETSGIPDDFLSRYQPEKLESWRRARETMDVFKLSTSAYSRHLMGKPALLRRFAAAHRGTPVCLDDTSATWAHHRSAQPTYAGSMGVIESLQRNGVDVRYVSLQSVLDKPTPDRTFYPMAKRVQDVVGYVRTCKARFPNIRVGILDAMPSHGRADWSTAYTMVRNALRQAGLSLDFFILDMPMSWAMKPGYMDKLYQVQRFVQTQMRWRFGWTVTLGLPGAPTDAEYRTQLLAGLRSYLERGGGADFMAVMSWSKQPRRSAPDSISIQSPTTTSMFREVDHRLPR